MNSKPSSEYWMVKLLPLGGTTCHLFLFPVRSCRTRKRKQVENCESWTRIIYRTLIVSEGRPTWWNYFFRQAAPLNGHHHFLSWFNDSEMSWIRQFVNGEKWASNVLILGWAWLAKNFSSVGIAHDLSTHHLQRTMIRFSIDFSSKTTKINAKTLVSF